MNDNTPMARRVALGLALVAALLLLLWLLRRHRRGNATTNA